MIMWLIAFTFTQSVVLANAIAKEIIEYHGGKIWVENRSTKGSSFFFTLEVAKQ